MKTIVFDIECDGLTPTKIHCLSATKEDGGIRSTVNYNHMRTFLTKAETLVGHNVSRFDIPALERLLEIKVKARLIDTLAISWYLEPDRIRHGLEYYGEDFGVPKPVIEDWEGLTKEEYIHRCEQDVRINTLLWEQQYKQLLKLYGTEEAVFKFLDYLQFKMDCARQQEEVKWKLDVDKAVEVRDRLVGERDKKIVELAYAMPKVPIYAEKSKPAKPYKKDGSLSKAGEDWFLFLENRGLPSEHEGTIEYIKDWKEPNPNSHEQIKLWLYSFGWKPITFQYKRDKVTGDVRTIAQIQQDKAKGPGLCISVKELFEKEPKLEVLDGLAILNHRISILDGFLGNVDGDGYLKAEIQGLTNTLRFKHKTIVNLPGVHNPYGEDIRGCLICPDGYELCGADMSGLEDRLKQHYIWPYDPEYVKQMLSDDFDPHLDLALLATAVTPMEFDEYKVAEHKDKRVKGIRHTYKQGNYACQYGAGGPRVALTCGISKIEGAKIVEIYWKRNWSIRAAAEAQTVKQCNGSKWLFNPVSKFWYSLRHDKDRFSTLVQGTAVYCFDVWTKYIRDKGPPLIATFHDEVVLLVKKGNRERCTNHINLAIEKTNGQLSLNRDLGCDVQYGANYASIH